MLKLRKELIKLKKECQERHMLILDLRKRLNQLKQSAKIKTMSERYGNCRLCHGRGTIIMYNNDSHNYTQDECPRCDGTGFSGDINDKKEE